MTVKQSLMKSIGFLNWVQLHPDDCKDLMMWCHNYQGEVFLSPDVHSLHILWTDLESNEISHEIADYPDDGTVKEFLDAEALDDAWETFDLDNVYSTLSDCKTWTRENTPVVTIEQLEIVDKIYQETSP